MAAMLKWIRIGGARVVVMAPALRVSRSRRRFSTLVRLSDGG